MGSQTPSTISTWTDNIYLVDHQALKWRQNCKDPSSRLIQWRLKLEEYQYGIEYTKGNDNTAADALSRIHCTTNEPVTLTNE
jgi:hypothetical protein